MTRKANIIQRLLLILLAVVISCPLLSQEVKSKKVPFVLNNLPDEKPPEITFLSPALDEEMKYMSDISETVITGRVSDESSLAFLAVGPQKLETDENGIFSARIRLYPGENRIRVLAADKYNNMQERILIIGFDPSGTYLRNTDTSQ